MKKKYTLYIGLTFAFGRTGPTVIARRTPGDVKAFAAVVLTLLIIELFVCLHRERRVGHRHY
jgi:hypothetical protein